MIWDFLASLPAPPIFLRGGLVFGIFFIFLIYLLFLPNLNIIKKTFRGTFGAFRVGHECDGADFYLWFFSEQFLVIFINVALFQNPIIGRFFSGLDNNLPNLIRIGALQNCFFGQKLIPYIFDTFQICKES